MPLAKQLPTESPCPCGNNKILGECCLPYIEGVSNAPTAEMLMRSRYTAHVLLRIDYLWSTWSPTERIRSSKEDIYNWANSCDWLSLRILNTQAGQANDTKGLVKFVALFRQNGQLHEHHELSLFKKMQQRWFYIGHQDE